MWVAGTSLMWTWSNKSDYDNSKLSVHHTNNYCLEKRGQTKKMVKSYPPIHLCFWEYKINNIVQPHKNPNKKNFCSVC